MPIARARRGELAPTLAMLEELRRYAPEYKRVDGDSGYWRASPID